jgi:hypothetical protein
MPYLHQTRKAQKDAGVMKNEEWQKLKSMEMDDWLSFINDDDELGLTTVKVKSKAPTSDEHLVAKFQEINEFYKANGRLPEKSLSSISELMLFKRLESIRDNTLQCHALVDFDEFNLLPLTHEVAEAAVEYKTESKPEPKPMVKEINSVEDIFADDDFGLLGDSDDSIFNIRHVKSSLTMPKTVARREQCKNFEEYEELFKQCHLKVQSGYLEMTKFVGEQQIQKGEFFVLNGVMCYVADMGEREKKGGKVNARLHLVFENGTESNMLLRSLATELYKDESGRRIIPTELDFEINEDDQSAGFIYVLSSQSQDPQISSIANLFKIGYATTPVVKRIANAAKEPTYLMAPVNVVAEYECYNMNTQKFENLIHTVFKDVCIDVEIADLQGNMCKPREWFSVPVDQINRAIELIVNGQIVNYRYNATAQKIELK